jgi:hypothetical protein
LGVGGLSVGGLGFRGLGVCDSVGGLGIGGLGVGVERVSSRHRGLSRAMALHVAKSVRRPLRFSALRGSDLSATATYKPSSQLAS